MVLVAMCQEGHEGVGHAERRLSAILVAVSRTTWET